MLRQDECAVGKKFLEELHFAAEVTHQRPIGIVWCGIMGGNTEEFNRAEALKLGYLVHADKTVSPIWIPAYLVEKPYSPSFQDKVTEILNNLSSTGESE